MLQFSWLSLSFVGTLSLCICNIMYLCPNSIEQVSTLANRAAILENISRIKADCNFHSKSIQKYFMMRLP